MADTPTPEQAGWMVALATACGAFLRRAHYVSRQSQALGEAREYRAQATQALDEIRALRKDFEQHTDDDRASQDKLALALEAMRINIAILLERSNVQRKGRHDAE